MIGAIIAAVGGLAKQWLSNKQQKSQAKHERELKIIANDATWEQQNTKNAQTSWKDEWFTVVLSVPMIGAFIPKAVPYIEEGFRVLDSMPDYYKGFLGASVAAAFGIKTLANYWNK